jgi:hypothetical protein
VSRYAEGTSVTEERSRAEIEQLLRRFGATGFAYGWDGNQAMVGFRASDRQVRFSLAMPEPSEFRLTATRQRRSDTATMTAYQAEVRRRWRALALAIKAKLEVVASGIATFDEEFLAHVVLPDGRTVGAVIAPELDAAHRGGIAPARLLPALPPGSPPP